MEGSILFSSYKEGIPPLLSMQDAEVSLFRAAIRMGTRKEFLDKLGGINYAFAEYGKINQYTIPLNKEVETLLLVSEDRPQQQQQQQQQQHENTDDRNNISLRVERIMQVLMKHCKR